MSVTSGPCHIDQCTQDDILHRMRITHVFTPQPTPPPFHCAPLYLVSHLVNAVLHPINDQIHWKYPVFYTFPPCYISSSTYSAVLYGSVTCKSDPSPITPLSFTCSLSIRSPPLLETTLLIMMRPLGNLYPGSAF